MQYLFKFQAWYLLTCVHIRSLNMVTEWKSLPYSKFHMTRISTEQVFSSVQFSSVQFSRSVVSDSFWPHESQHARPPCLSPTPRVHPNSCPLNPWCHPAISSSVVPFSSCPQSLRASESFPMSQLFSWGGQSTGVSALASFLSKKSQGWSPSEWTGWISLGDKAYISWLLWSLKTTFTICLTHVWNTMLRVLPTYIIYNPYKNPIFKMPKLKDLRMKLLVQSHIASK